MSFLKYQQYNPEFLNEFLKYTRYVSQYSETSVNELYIDIRTFLRYLIYLEDKEEYEKLSYIIFLEKFKAINIKEFDVSNLNSITPFIIEDFLFFLKNVFNNSPITRNRKLASLKLFFRYLAFTNDIAMNPALEISYGNIGKRLPKYMNLSESKQLLSAAILNDTRNTIRNYAIVCLFLNCCLRLSELTKINIEDLKLDDKIVKIKGKGNKERILYLNEAAIEAIQEYLKVRPELSIKNKDHNALFLSEQRRRISNRNVQNIIEQTLVIALGDEKGKKLHTHSLRHTGATLLYDTGNTNILIIQQILGHKNLTSTEIYTHVSEKRLKEFMLNWNLLNIKEKEGKVESWKIIMKKKIIA